MGFFSRLFKRKPKNRKYEMGLHKSREAFSNLSELLKTTKKIDSNLFDAIEDLFIGADVGVDTVIYFIDKLKKEINIKRIEDPLMLQEIIVDILFDIYLQGELVDTNLKFEKGKVNVYLFVGVNGTGKTTSIGKIANALRKDKKKVLVVAGDTFRAGAIEQLSVWVKRAGADFFAKEQGSDPSSVVYDALTLAKKDYYDCVLIDTAGRLQTKVNLMAELNKVHRVISKVIPEGASETLLVVDATTGQNGVIQAKEFKEATDLTGVILTKMDGTAKGGIVLAIRNLYKIPIKYIGFGEKIDDLIPFDIEDYIYSLFADFFK